jgi:hypothetical protein
VKACTKCGETKPLDEFYKQAAGMYGVKSRCKSCSYKDKEAWIKKNPEAKARYDKTYRASHLVQKKAYYKRWESDNRVKVAVRKTEASRNARIGMSDWYIVTCLERRNFTPEQITPDLIAAERALIKLKRAVKEIES